MIRPALAAELTEIHELSILPALVKHRATNLAASVVLRDRTTGALYVVSDDDQGELTAAITSLEHHPAATN